MAVMTNLLPKELVVYLESRKKIYQFLHFLFQEPVYESDLLKVRDNNKIKELSQLYEGGKILFEFLNHLSRKNLKKEREEYKRLFLGPGPLGAPPWESYYRSIDHLLFEEGCCQLRKRYHNYGLMFIRENNEPDDHLLLELEFLIFLINACIKEQKVDHIQLLISEQISFIENHLAKWIPLFCERVIDCSNSPLFVGAAMLLTDYLDHDLESLYEFKKFLLLAVN